MGVTWMCVCMGVCVCVRVHGGGWGAGGGKVKGAYRKSPVTLAPGAMTTANTR